MSELKLFRFELLLFRIRFIYLFLCFEKIVVERRDEKDREIKDGVL